MTTTMEDQQKGETQSLLFVPLDYIVPSKYQPRRHFDEQALQELADSIGEIGLLQPLVVRQINPLRYELIAGERRWRAAGLACMSEVPCLVKHCGDQQALQLALIENIQREDLNALEEAEGIQRLIDEFQFTHESAAQAVGKGRSYVTNRLRMLELPERVKMYLEMGKIEVGHAMVLCGLPGEWQVLKANEVIKKKLTVRQLEAQAQAQFNRTNKRTATKNDPNIRQLANQLSEATGCTTEIDHKGKIGGKVIITYHSLEELEGYLEFFRHSPKD